MSDSDHVTHGQLKDKLENVSLRLAEEVGKMIDQKHTELLERFDKAQINGRDRVCLQVTGYEFEQRDKVKLAIGHAYKEAVNKSDTNATVKKAVLGFAIPAGIGGAVSWVVTHWKG